MRQQRGQFTERVTVSKQNRWPKMLTAKVLFHSTRGI